MQKITKDELLYAIKQSTRDLIQAMHESADDNAGFVISEQFFESAILGVSAAVWRILTEATETTGHDLHDSIKGSVDKSIESKEF